VCSSDLFVHGVMNTDNMSILGLTIDYGPYGWLEGYDPAWTPNTTDASTRRYSFGNQPGIAQWNLAKLAQAVYPLIGKPDGLSQGIEYFGDIYKERWQAMMFQKLGLNVEPSYEKEKLVTELLDLLAVVETDMTIFFRQLARLDHTLPVTAPDTMEQLKAPLQQAYYKPDQKTDAYENALDEWLMVYVNLLNREDIDPEARRESMNKVNPKYVLRNYMAQLAIDQAEAGDTSLIHELMELVAQPYDEQPDMEAYYAKRPDWARNKPGCSMLSCSS
jgi:uncharacterized protein YdiU (UPF0061 family)